MSLCQQRRTKGRSRVFASLVILIDNWDLTEITKNPQCLRKEATWTQSRLSQMGTQMKNQKICTQVWFSCDLYQAVIHLSFSSALSTEKGEKQTCQSQRATGRLAGEASSPLTCWASASTLYPKSLSKPQTPDLVFGVKSLPHPSSGT